MLDSSKVHNSLYHISERNKFTYTYQYTVYHCVNVSHPFNIISLGDVQIIVIGG